MSAKIPYSIKQILAAKGSGLNQLLQQTKNLETLNRRIAGILPSPLPQHCAAAGLDQHTLILVVDSAIWATRLRLHFPMIIKGLGDLQINSITLRVNPAKPVSQPSRPRAKMTKKTSNLLIQLAETMSDPKLKNALHRLAKHAGK